MNDKPGLPKVSFLQYYPIFQRYDKVNIGIYFGDPQYVVMPDKARKDQLNKIMDKLVDKKSFGYAGGGYSRGGYAGGGYAGGGYAGGGYDSGWLQNRFGGNTHFTKDKVGADHSKSTTTQGGQHQAGAGFQGHMFDPLENDYENMFGSYGEEVIDEVPIISAKHIAALSIDERQEIIRESLGGGDLLLRIDSNAETLMDRETNTLVVTSLAEAFNTTITKNLAELSSDLDDLKKLLTESTALSKEEVHHFCTLVEIIASEENYTSGVFYAQFLDNLEQLCSAVCDATKGVEVVFTEDVFHDLSLLLMDCLENDISMTTMINPEDLVSIMFEC